jgi:hypothetical protein
LTSPARQEYLPLVYRLPTALRAERNCIHECPDGSVCNAHFIAQNSGQIQRELSGGSILLMARAPIAFCALCRHIHELRNSHLLPKKAYSALVPLGGKQNYRVTNSDEYYTTSRHFTDYLLCSGCEKRFDKFGEGWVLRNSHKKNGFLFRDALGPPAFIDSDGLQWFTAGSLPQLRLERFVYFGLSVFWRAGVHVWIRGRSVVHIDLGCYLEPIRKYLEVDLPGTQAFPDYIALHIQVSALKIPYVMNAPEGHNGLYAFQIPGLIFKLFTGIDLPTKITNLSTAPSPSGFVSIDPFGDIEMFEEAKQRDAERRHSSES